MNQDDERRYWALSLDRMTNIPDLLRTVADHGLEGIVDENAGGIVAYAIGSENADRIVAALNAEAVRDA